ncbi:MAG: phosphate butyryltransferase [candidate division Zixibacteria bacterium]|nr:phosphate butyryltransferase [candidate division Zixibacteria bacterium]
MAQNIIHSSKELIARAIAIAGEGRRKTVAVAAAQDTDVIGAVAQAQTEGFLNGILVGDVALIKKLAGENDIDIGSMELVDKKDITEAAHYAARLAADKKADAIMKGFLPTSALLKVVLDKQYGLRGSDTLSHCAVIDIPGYHKMLNFTDGGMVVKPDVDQKYRILENAVMVGRALGLSPVKVAISAATESITDKIAHIISDVEEIRPRAMAELEDVIVEGPLSLDTATSKKAAAFQGIDNPVAGEADIYLVNSIEEANIVVKSLIQFAGAIFCGVIVGAKVPVSLVSRTDTVMNKKASLALACVISDYYTQNHIWE